jgi:small-conductance mechanosensitive channel
VAQSALAGAGVLAVVIGIASQEVLANIMGGTFIVIFKPFRVGDTVQINTVSGQVEDITLRHTVVKSFQNQRIVIPNAVINKEQIINYNLHELAIMQEEAMNHPYFYDNRTESEINREEPAVRAKVLGLRESSVVLRAWVWARNYPAGFNLRLDLYKSIKERFDREGIEIPFPHRTIVLNSTSKCNN